MKWFDFYGMMSDSMKHDAISSLIDLILKNDATASPYPEAYDLSSRLNTKAPSRPVTLASIEPGAHLAVLKSLIKNFKAFPATTNLRTEAAKFLLSCKVIQNNKSLSDEAKQIALDQKLQKELSNVSDIRTYIEEHGQVFWMQIFKMMSTDLRQQVVSRLIASTAASSSELQPPEDDALHLDM